MKISEDMIAQEAHATLDGLGDEAVGFRLAVERKLAAISAPRVSWNVDSGDTGFVGALVGRRRDFLCVEDARFREYTVLISARPNGRVLRVSWLLLADAHLINDLRRALRLHTEDGGRFDIGAELNVFDVLDLNDFLAVTKLAFRTAIREFMQPDEADDPDGESAAQKI